MDEVGKHFAAAVKAARNELGWSQMRLAQEIKVSIDAVSAIERSVNTPSLATTAALVRVLGIDANELFKRAKRVEVGEQRLKQEAELMLMAQDLDADGIKLLVEMARVLRLVHKAAPTADQSSAGQEKPA